jgi:hypothetical protein
MRRLGLLLGIAGAMLGGFYSINELKTILAYHKFNSLAESDFVKKQTASYVADVEKARTAYIEQEHWVESQMAAARGKDGLGDASSAARLALQGSDYSGRLALTGADFLMQADQRFSRIEALHSEINRSGIRGVQWTHGYAKSSINPDYPWPRQPEIVSIVTQDGETLYQTAPPRFWAYALLILAPAFGFLFPWGIVWGIEWVLAGFSRKDTV